MHQNRYRNRSFADVEQQPAGGQIADGGPIEPESGREKRTQYGASDCPPIDVHSCGAPVHQPEQGIGVFFESLDEWLERLPDGVDVLRFTVMRPLHAVGRAPVQDFERLSGLRAGQRAGCRQRIVGMIEIGHWCGYPTGAANVTGMPEARCRLADQPSSAILIDWGSRRRSRP